MQARAIALSTSFIVTFATSMARADIAPGAFEYGFLFFGALVMAIPSGLALGSLAYLILSRDKAEDPDEKDLPLWGKRLWRRSVQASIAVVFVGLVALAVIASSVRRHRDRPLPEPSSSAAPGGSSGP